MNEKRNDREERKEEGRSRERDGVPFDPKSKAFAESKGVPFDPKSKAFAESKGVPFDPKSKAFAESKGVPFDPKSKAFAESKGIIAGRNAVTEALRSGRPIDTLFVARGLPEKGSVAALAAKAREAGAAVKEADGRKLDAMCGGAVHQGVVAVAAVREFASVDELFALAEERGEAPFFILADELADPHNLGAILRTAECAGAHGVIIPKRRSVGLTYAVGKASAGAVEYVPVARVANLAACMDELKRRGVWIFGADMDGTPWCEADFTGPAAIVIGSEGFGMSRLVKEKCDFIVSLPMKGKINSLNASVACGVLAYEAARQRAGLKAR